jgi:hypothetical protein
VYFSKGVLLEAQLIAKDLAEQAQRWGVHRVVQVFRAGDIGEEAARTVTAAAAAAGLQSTSHVIQAEARADGRSLALQDVAADDAVVLWLRPNELAALPAEPVRAAAVFASGLMGGLENAPLPAPWRGAVRITYPADLPDGRAVRMHIPLAWFKVRNVPIVAERVQADTYLACGIVAEQLTGMLDRFEREVLLERFETMLNTRLFTGYYSRLGLAQGQRFASKGGYIARFAESQGARLVADGGYTVP